MPLTLPSGEPEAGPWRSVALDELIDSLLTAAGDPSGRPRVVAIDGRGGAGKSSLAERIAHRVPSSVVVHTDDLAWHEPLFGWSHHLASVLQSLHQDGAVTFCPPQWEQRGRPGDIAVPQGTALVIVEGTGASQRDHAPLVDATVWVQADFAEAGRRALARDLAEGVNGGPDECAAFWDTWMKEEIPFFARERPWLRACMVVNGTPAAAQDDEHVVLAEGLSPAHMPGQG